VGALLFVHGVLDLVLDVMFCVTLSKCGELLLLGCAATTLLATFLTTWYLGAWRRITRADIKSGHRYHSDVLSVFDVLARAQLKVNPLAARRFLRGEVHPAGEPGGGASEKVGPELGPTSDFYSCIYTGVHRPT
jgi:hypothetical protein